MSRVPVFRPIHWPALLLHVVLIALAFWIGSRVTVDPLGAGFGGLVFIGYSLLTRKLLTTAHRRGIRYMKQQRYEQAIEAFRESYAFFNRHAWVDRYRAITMLSCAAMSYREMSLINLAFAYSQLGDGRAAKEFYQLAIREFPKSGMAAAALRLIESVERSQTDVPDVDKPMHIS
jgi:tetratricopeptide (TPR) repeat protein